MRERHHAFFAGLDLWVVLDAACVALVASWLTTLRARQAQRLQGLPLSSELTAIPDTPTGAAVGTGLAVFIPRLWHLFDTFTGVSLLAALGGITGPRLWDMVSSERGLRGVLYVLGNTALPLLGKFMASQKKDGESDGQQTPRP